MSTCLPACLTICDVVSATKPNVRFIKFGTKVLYKKLPLKLEFYANHLNDSHTVLKHINELLPTFSIFLDWSWVELCMKNIHIMPLSGCEFHKNLYSKRHTFLISINEILLIFYIFTKFGLKKMYRQNSLKNFINVSFVKISAMKATLYLRAYISTYPYFPHILSNLGLNQ